MEKQKTLEDLIKEGDVTDIKTALPSLVEHLNSLSDGIKEQEKGKLASFQKVLEGIVESNKSLAEAIKGISDNIEKIANRPEPKFPEPKDFPKEMRVWMDKPAWQKDPEKLDMAAALKPLFAKLSNAISMENQKTNTILLALLNKEPETKEEATEEPKAESRTVNTGSVRSRRTTQWKRFDNYDLKNLLNPSGDNQTYFMPDSLIPNSETIRLNEGLPLKNSDYTLSGNKIFFSVINQPGTIIEIRGQVK
jgi:hypothetical protein